MGASDVPDARPEADAGHGETRGYGLLRLLAIPIAVAITAAIILFREDLARFANYGYLGVFVVSVLGNATVILPVPSLLAVFAGGTAFNPIIVGLVAGMAEPLGELTGYLAGFGGGAILENRKYYSTLRRFMERRGFLTIAVLAAIPNPLFDLAGITAGALHMPVWQFLIACWLGKTGKALLVAWLGAQSVGWLAPLWRALG
jgi:membrane protein YqaA with SNARE-associated domain